MAITFKRDSAGFRQAAVSSEIRAAVTAKAKEAEAVAKSLASEITVTGEYEASFNVRTEDVELTTGFGAHAVAAGILENTAPHAAAVEWGNARDHRPHHILSRAIDGIGHG